MKFFELMQGWADSACAEWGYPSITADQLAGVPERLPLGLQALIEKGHDDGAIKTVGLRFTLAGLPDGIGPYAWLSKDPRHVPAVNWEYLVQAAEYVRVHGQSAPLGFKVLAEDRLMDITVERDGTMLWYIEVKEKAADLPLLAERIAAYGAAGVDLEVADRGNDPLQKARYLVRYRPRYFSLTAIGMRLDYRSEYVSQTTFRLIPDMVPLP